MQYVEDYLKSHNIDYKLHEHPAVFTCEESDIHCAHIPGLHCKNLFLRTKKHDRHFLITLPSEKKADLKKFAEIVGEKKITFASPEVLKEKLDLTPGSVSPCGLLNDSDQKVEFFLDKDVYEADIVSFHPNRNTASLEITKEMFHKFLETLPHKVNIYV